MKNTRELTYDVAFIFFLILCSFFCKANRFSSNEKSMNLEKVSKAEAVNHDEKIRLCVKKLDNCFSDCDDRFSTTQRINYIERGSCRDACVVSTLRESTDCMIYYQSSRR